MTKLDDVLEEIWLMWDVS